MSDDTSARLKLPLIQPGQAQKELSHNEALALLDLLVQPTVVTLGRNDPPTDPGPGQAWIVGATPSGSWTGQPNALAGWTMGGWRYVMPTEGMSVWVLDSRRFAQFDGTGWAAGDVRGHTLTLDGSIVVGARRAAIADVAAGTVIDTEARVAIAAILGALRGHGLIAP